MKIAVLLACLRFDSQKKIVSGILEDALPEGDNVYIFACDIGTKSTVKDNAGEVQVYSLANFSLFDGVVLHGDTIQPQTVVERLAAKIKEASIPAVSINQHYEGMCCVELENDTGIYEIVNHMVQKHGAKKINFVSGLLNSTDAQARYEAYKRGLENNKVPFDEKRVYRGDWHPRSGEAAVESFLERDAELPDAIVSANDEMALGVFYALQARGIKVPEQVLISGYDNSMIGQYNSPSLTSVRRPDVKLGKAVYKILKEWSQEKLSDKVNTIVCEPIYGESCGCCNCEWEDNRGLLSKFVKDKLHVSRYADIVRFSAGEFINVETYDELFEVIKKYTLSMNLEEFYLCMCETKEIVQNDISFQASLDEVNKGYTEKMHIPLLYRNGEFSSHGVYSVSTILPEKYTEGTKGNYYTIIPLHYQEYCYGYFVLCNSRLYIDSDVFRLFIINVDNALENIRQKNLSNGMIERLNRMWVSDNLTGIFNRSGFFKYAPVVRAEARMYHKSCFVIFIDLDGLKKVNDQYGHDEGDRYIKAMVDVLVSERGQSELLMRWGGDEFVVLATGDSEAAASKYVEKLHAGIATYNDKNKNENVFVLKASIGYAMVNVNIDSGIKDAINVADQEMYKIKKAKRMKETAESGS